MLSDLSLGQVWAVDLQKNEMVVRDVLLVAQGEMALEEFLKQVMRVLPLSLHLLLFFILYFVPSSQYSTAHEQLKRRVRDTREALASKGVSSRIYERCALED